MSADRGQSTVELVAAATLLLVAAAAAAQALAWGRAREAARAAAAAGAMALVQGGDPARVAVAAAPGWARRRIEVIVGARSVRVVVRPRMPAVVADVLGPVRAESRVGGE